MYLFELGLCVKIHRMDDPVLRVCFELADYHQCEALAVKLIPMVAETRNEVVPFLLVDGGDIELPQALARLLERDYPVILFVQLVPGRGPRDHEHKLPEVVENGEQPHQMVEWAMKVGDVVEQ